MGKYTIVEGHPDPSEQRFNAALANAYAEAALVCGHEVRRIKVAQLDFPLVRSYDEFYHGTPPSVIADAQRDIAWADHLIFFFPLWIADAPALLRAFIEQTFRPGFAIGAGERFPKKLLSGKTARIVVTMGMPSFIYRTTFRAHMLKSLVMSLEMCGVTPVRTTPIGGIESASERSRRRWLRRMAALAARDGRKAARRAPLPLRAVGVILLAGAAAYAAYAALTWMRFAGAKRRASLIDAVMPAYDVGLYHELRIEAPASVVFETIDRVSFDSAPVARALFRARAALLRARSDGDRASGGFIEQMTELGWKIVARDPGRELVFGAVTQPWRPNPEFRGLAPEEFAAFDEPGYAKLALTIRVDPFDENASVVCTETRVQSTDQTSYALFRRYWALFSPGIEVIRVALLHRLKNEAERLSSAT